MTTADKIRKAALGRKFVEPIEISMWLVFVDPLESLHWYRADTELRRFYCLFVAEAIDENRSWDGNLGSKG